MNQTDAIQLLCYDQVEKPFKQFESARNDSAKEEIVRKACLELIMHAQIEEDLPAVRH
jgi:hypothetical protein